MNEAEKDKLFGEVGVDLGFITTEDVAKALENQKVDEAIGERKPIGAYLLGAGKLNKEQIGKIVVIQEKLIAKTQFSQSTQSSLPLPSLQIPQQKNPIAIHANQHPSYGSYTAVGLLIWPLGLLIGIAFMLKSDPLEHKLGEHTLVVSILSAIIFTPLLNAMLK